MPKVAATTAPRRMPKKIAAPGAQSPLFEPTDLPPAPARAGVDWIGLLLANPVYLSQRQLAARVALPDDRMRLLLEALSDRGGKLSRVALAQRLSVAEIRLGGILSAVRRMLNVDQAPVLTVDDAAGTVELNLVLLQQQFGVSAPGVRR
jgi:hypothetical protein